MAGMTPPFGVSLFVAKELADVPLSLVYRSSIPFILAFFLCLGFCIAFEPLSTVAARHDAVSEKESPHGGDSVPRMLSGRRCGAFPGSETKSVSLRSAKDVAVQEAKRRTP